MYFYIQIETYQARTRRSTIFQQTADHLVNNPTISHQVIDESLAEKRILAELGPKACVLEEPCRIHAARNGKAGEQPDWNDILR